MSNNEALSASGTDQLARFLLPELGIRIAIARIEAVQAELLSRHSYPAEYSEELSKLACAAALLCSTVKLEGRLLLQRRTQVSGAQVLCECNHLGEIRGLARIPDIAPTPSLLASAGVLAITLEPEQGERYQGIVAVDAEIAEHESEQKLHASAGSLVTALESYFERSEQIPTRIFLAHSTTCSVGMIAQRIPGEGGIGALDEDGWNRAQHLFQTLHQAELLAIDANELMGRLFSEEKVQVLKSQTLRFHCTCSKNRLKHVLISLGAHEAMACVQPDGFVSATCEFCSSHYQFDAFEIGGWFAAAEQISTQH
jgi:molecular chaperone Hsp33